MLWSAIPETVDAWTTTLLAPAQALRKAAALVYTQSPVGYYYHPVLACAGLFAPLASHEDSTRCKQAAMRAVGSAGVRKSLFTYQELSDPYGQWVKVAHSPTLRGAGEALNFFPGQYPGGLPNHASPVAAMLTSGLLGAGLGWGGGHLLKKLAPEEYGENLPRTGMMLGGLLGAAPGALLGLSNLGTGKSFNDKEVLGPSPPTSNPADYPEIQPNPELRLHPMKALEPFYLPGYDYADAAANALQRHIKRNEDLFAELEAVPLGKAYCAALAECRKQADDTRGEFQPRRAPRAGDVNLDALGRTLWDLGAPPQLAATTMSAMYAAQQLPDADSQPGVATGSQLGQLAMNAGADYGKGYLAGVAINTLIGSPYRAASYGLGSVALGVIGAVVPKLFGR